MNHVEVKLQEELERLKNSSNLGLDLDVIWLPRGSNPLLGEVVGKTIKIYHSDEAKAIETLRHEFLDYNVSQAIEPYKTIANALVKLLNAEAYACKEGILEGLGKLLFSKGVAEEEEN